MCTATCNPPAVNKYHHHNVGFQKVKAELFLPPEEEIP
jgi:hypothetical protein